jgi:hypothetical protein
MLFQKCGRYLNMKKIISLTLLIFLGTVFIGFSILMAKTHPKNDFLNYQRPPVQFLEKYHDLHMDNEDCLECHHKYKNGKNILNEDDLEDENAETSCASCHNNKVKLNLQQAYHEQCIGCHERLSAKNIKSGPVLCGKCHVRTKTG